MTSSRRRRMLGRTALRINQTTSGFTQVDHFLRHETASMSRIGGGGGGGCSALGKRWMTSSRTPTALGRYSLGIDLSAALSKRSHCLGVSIWQWREEPSHLRRRDVERTFRAPRPRRR